MTKLTTQNAVANLVRAEILPPHEHPHPKLEAVAWAMYRSKWWKTVTTVIPNEPRGEVLNLRGGWVHPKDVASGEIQCPPQI